MQIFGSDVNEASVACSGKGATSVFFKVDPDNPTAGNAFFNWQANAGEPGGDVQLDLGLV